MNPHKRYVSVPYETVLKPLRFFTSLPVGLKLQGLGDGGYIYSWEATRPRLAEFQQNTIKFSVAIPGITPPVFAFLTATQSMVARLGESLPKGRQFHLYLDNLFVC